MIDIGTFLAVDNDTAAGLYFLEIDGPVLIIRRTSVDPVVDGQPFGVQPRPDDIYIHIYFMYMDIKRRRSCCSFFHFPFDSLNGRGSFCLFFAPAFIIGTRRGIGLFIINAHCWSSISSSSFLSFSLEE